ncbi:type VI secretion system-associated protein TagF [Pseudoxanthomonas putridarboris]|uniref:Type VI secretion system-associated protein TagF n=1 Tax=Pseudoxanthomonas putridarboris TaxID=752605 RepID=A0ABU9J377_9GAMM
MNVRFLPQVGCFGKLPGVGDFVQRRLPAAFLDAWDPGFQQALAASRRWLGERWPAAYHGSAAWRFVLPAQVCGDRAWAGVTGAATDRVGRCFPMVIAAPFADGDAEVARILENDAWFGALEVIHRQAQAAPLIDARAFDAALARLPGPLARFPERLPTSEVVAASDRAGSVDGDRLHGLPSLAANVSERRCLWWTQGNADRPADRFATHGLPDPDTYLRMLGTARDPVADPGDDAPFVLSDPA